jgi:hypothetical protein
VCVLHVALEASAVVQCSRLPLAMLITDLQYVHLNRYIGFDGTDSMARAAATAGVVLSALVGLRVRPTVKLDLLAHRRCCVGVAAAAFQRNTMNVW